jgi:hypothetical protein
MLQPLSLAQSPQAAALILCPDQAPPELCRLPHRFSSWWAGRGAERPVDEASPGPSQSPFSPQIAPEHDVDLDIPQVRSLRRLLANFSDVQCRPLPAASAHINVA